MDSQWILQHNGDQRTPLHKDNCKAGVIPKRYVLTLLGSLGFFCVYSMRVNLNVALVAMVKGPPLPPPALLREDAEVVCRELLVPPANLTTSSPEVRGEFDWDSNLQGIVLGSFYYGYVLTQIPGGVLAEKYGAKWIFGLGILLTAVLSLLTPIAARWSVWALILTRVFEGLGEGVTFPAMHSLIGLWIPQQERSLLSTLVYSGSYVGTVASLVLSGLLCDSPSQFLGGWPSAFYIFGSFGCVWFVLWIAFVHDSPEDHPSISKEELLHIRLGQDDVRLRKSPVPWKQIFGSVPVWGLVVTHFGNNWAFYTILTDLPTYLSNVLHFDLGKNGTVSAVPNLIEVVVAIFSSMVADKLLASGRLRTTTIRKIMNSIAFFVPAACLLFVPFLGCRAVVIVVLLSSVVSLNGFVYSGFNVTHLDMSPEFAGTLMGITNCIANIPGFLAPSFVGWMIQDGVRRARFTTAALRSETPYLQTTPFSSRSECCWVTKSKLKENSQENWGKVFVVTSAIFFISGVVFNIFCTAELQPWGSNERPSGDVAAEVTAATSDLHAAK